MIYGVGTDISQVNRFEKWVSQPDMFLRFFNDREQYQGDLSKNSGNACRHYAARFAAKEAFAKALGTGFSGLKLSDFWVSKTDEGKPFFEFGQYTKDLLKQRLGSNYNIQLSISHEKEYAVAFVIIEIIS